MRAALFVGLAAGQCRAGSAACGHAHLCGTAKNYANRTEVAIFEPGTWTEDSGCGDVVFDDCCAVDDSGEATDCCDAARLTPKARAIDRTNNITGKGNEVVGCAALGHDPASQTVFLLILMA